MNIQQYDLQFKNDFCNMNKKYWEVWGLEGSMIKMCCLSRVHSGRATRVIKREAGKLRHLNVEMACQKLIVVIAQN